MLSNGKIGISEWNWIYALIKRESKMNVRFGPTAIPSYNTSDLLQQRTYDSCMLDVHHILLIRPTLEVQIILSDI